MKQCTPVKPHKYDKLEYLCAVQHFNCNIPKIEVEKNVKYLDTITPLMEYDALGGYERDTIYLVIPHNQEDINCLNIINGYFCQYCEPLFEEGRRNGYHDFKMWCEDNTNNDTEKMIIKKIANEVNTIGTYLFE